ncbi:hypothetical protein NIES4074_32140 [Cylindrospermum sp. NIES-4074]|nr:hypothetical protein NIES4074_32140 [Cylindrospermum sp. NIES-4074]
MLKVFDKLGIKQTLKMNFQHIGLDFLKIN